MERRVKNTLNLHICAMIMQLFFGTCLMQAVEPLDATCKKCLTAHYQSARDNIIKVLTVIDLLRSITITPQARATFAHQMFADSVAAMHDMAALATSCQFCADYYKQHARDLVYLEEILGYVTEAFSAVFTPVLVGEEKLLAAVMAHIVQSMEQIHKQVGTPSSVAIFLKNE